MKKYCKKIIIFMFILCSIVCIFIYKKKVNIKEKIISAEKIYVNGKQYTQKEVGEINIIDKKKYDNYQIDKVVEKQDIELSQEMVNTIDEITSKDLTEADYKKLEKWNLTEDEFREELAKDLTLMEKRVKLKKELISEINSNNISIDNDEFKRKVTIYNENKNENDKAFKECLELLDEYIEILTEDY